MIFELTFKTFSCYFLVSWMNYAFRYEKFNYTYRHHAGTTVICLFDVAKLSWHLCGTAVSLISTASTSSGTQDLSHHPMKTPLRLLALCCRHLYHCLPLKWRRNLPFYLSISCHHSSLHLPWPTSLCLLPHCRKHIQRHLILQWRLPLLNYPYPLPHYHRHLWCRMPLQWFLPQLIINPFHCLQKF